MKRLSLYIFLVLMWCNVGFAEMTKKEQPTFRPHPICDTLNLSKSECNKKLKEIDEKLEDLKKQRAICLKNRDSSSEKCKKFFGEGFDIKEKYSCVLKDASNVETAKWTLSINRFSYKSFVVENSCCPERGKRFAIYDKEYPAKLKWFDLIDQDLYFDSLELSDTKVRHKNFSIKLETSDYNRFNKLYKNAENAKVDESLNEIREEEKFYYSANAFFREGMKDNNNFTALFDANCK